MGILNDPQRLAPAPLPDTGPDAMRDIRGEFTQNLSDLISQSVFGTPSMSAGLKGRISDQVIMASHLAGNMVNGQTGVRADPKKEKEEQEKDATKFKRLESFMSEQRRAQQWAATPVTYLGTTMTGSEWHQFSEELSNPQSEVRQQKIEDLVANGNTVAAAEHGVQLAAKATASIAKPPEKRTLADKKAEDDCNHNKICKTVVSGATPNIIETGVKMTQDFANSAGSALKSAGDATMNFFTGNKPAAPTPAPK